MTKNRVKMAYFTENTKSKTRKKWGPPEALRMASSPKSHCNSFYGPVLRVSNPGLRVFEKSVVSTCKRKFHEIYQCLSIFSKNRKNIDFPAKFPYSANGIFFRKYIKLSKN